MWVDKAIHRSHKEMWARKTPVAPKQYKLLPQKLVPIRTGRSDITTEDATHLGGRTEGWGWETKL